MRYHKAEIPDTNASRNSIACAMALLAQSADDRRVAGWTVGKFKNGALSALPTLAAFHFMLFVIWLNGRSEPN
jgi:hypothetical protein